MKALRNYLDKIKPNFEEGGKFHAFRSVFDGFETFLFVPNATSKSGTHIHDSIDSKRIMSMVVIASMIGARGLGEDVLVGIQTLNVGKGLEAGLAIVILAVVIDRITQAYGRPRHGDQK